MKRRSSTGALALLGFAFAFVSYGCRKELPDRVADDAVDPPMTACEQSNVCRQHGWCALVNGECRPAAPEHCRGSVACQKGGLCTYEPYDSKCIARGDDCSGSKWCEVYGLCKAKEGVCK